MAKQNRDQVRVLETEDGVPDACGTTFSGPDAWVHASRTC